MSDANPREVTDDESRALEADARQRGFAIARVDFASCESARDAFAAIASAFAFPGWFGMNWDALSDCLRDLGFAPAPGHLFVIEGLESWRRRSASEVETFLEIVDEAIAFHRDHDEPFEVAIVVASDADRPERA